MTDQPQTQPLAPPPSEGSITHYSTCGGDPGFHAPKIIEFMHGLQPTCRDRCNRMSIQSATGAALFLMQEGGWGQNAISLGDVDAFMTDRGYQWVGQEYVERCEECSDKWSYPWADKLDPKLVEAYIRQYCPNGVVELARLKLTLGPTIKPEEIATADDLQAQVSGSLTAFGRRGSTGSYVAKPLPGLVAPKPAEPEPLPYAAYVARIRANL